MRKVKICLPSQGTQGCARHWMELRFLLENALSNFRCLLFPGTNIYRRKIGYLAKEVSDLCLDFSSQHLLPSYLQAWPHLQVVHLFSSRDISEKP